jgi:hypothetical protein
MAIKNINDVLGIDSKGKKKEKDDSIPKVYFNKKAHRIVLRFDPGFKSNTCEFLFDDEYNKLIIIEGRNISVDIRKLTKDKHGSFVTSYKKLFDMPHIPANGSLSAIKETVGVPRKNGKIMEVKGYSIDLNLPVTQEPEVTMEFFDSNESNNVEKDSIPF